MAIYERTQRESAHVFSRVIDKSQVPSALTWAAIGCVTASKGELNKVYQCGTTDYLNSVFGDPSKDHISLICASKIIAEDNTMFLIRVAHENSLRGAQAIISTETNYNNPTKAIGVLEPDDNPVKKLIQLKEEDAPQSNLRNISSTLSFSLDNEEELIKMSNKRIAATYRDVYQIDSKGNKNVSNELCLLLSDVADLSAPITVKLSDSGVELEISKYTTNWFYGDGYAKRSVIVLSPSAGVVENRNCDIEFSLKQVAQRAYGTATPNKVVVPVIITSNASGSDDEGGDDDVVENVWYTELFDAVDITTI